MRQFYGKFLLKTEVGSPPLGTSFYACHGAAMDGTDLKILVTSRFAMER
ncbi:MAG TPA: hypothetical protein VF704_09460 [Allosphingosinicella sp.]